MDKDRVKGAIDDAAGRVRRQAGEWTGDTDAQVEGAAQQVKGKIEKAVGKVKDAARKAEENARRHIQPEPEEDSERHETPHAYAVNRHSAY